MAGMDLWLAARCAQAKGTSWMIGWVTGATREVTRGPVVSQEHCFIGKRAHEGR